MLCKEANADRGLNLCRMLSMACCRFESAASPLRLGALQMVMVIPPSPVLVRSGWIDGPGRCRYSSLRFAPDYANYTLMPAR
jgi:hypothetical protein